MKKHQFLIAINNKIINNNNNHNIITLSITAKTAVADPRAKANVFNSGRAFPKATLPVTMENNTCKYYFLIMAIFSILLTITTSPGPSSQFPMSTAPYL